jgi:hypothetical protein
MDSADMQPAADPVRTYLAQLEVALAGADAALRHDALVDAEAHLRAAVRAGASPERAVAEYGAPAEIARAYADAESGPRGWREIPAPQAVPAGSARTTSAAGTGAQPSPAVGATNAPTAPRGLRAIPVIGIWFDVRAWGALAYFGAVGFALSLAYFVWAISMGALAVGLLPLALGIPLLVLLLGSARALCLFEGKVVEFFLRVRMPRRVQPVAGAGAVGFWTRIGCWLRDVRSWLSLGYLLGNFPVALVTFVIVVTLVTMGAALVAMPLMSALSLPAVRVEDPGDFQITVMGQAVTPDADGNYVLPVVPALLLALVGLAILTGTLWLVRGFGWVYGHVVQAIQVARPQPVGTNTNSPEPPIVVPQ